MSGSDLGFIHRFVPAPSGGAAEDTPTLLLLHGTGGNESDLLSLGWTLAPDAALLSPRGKVLERGMPRFFRRLAEGVFDEEDLKRRTHELADFVHAAAQAYGLDQGSPLWGLARIVAVGFSNGANIAGSTLLLRPGVLSGAILLRPMVPLTPDPLPDLSGTPVLIAAGRQDPMSPPDETERLAALLRQCRAVVDIHWSPAGHNLTQADIDAARTWLESHRTAH